MIIALINWRILRPQVAIFLDEWKTKLPLNNAKGLIGEFLSKVEDASYFDKITWEMESDDADDKTTWLSTDFVSYVNVGLWETYDDFIEAVGKKMTVGRSLGQPFEAAPRRRAILTPEHWRRGGLSLPKTTSNGVFP
jgi:hypothetical protein